MPYPRRAVALVAVAAIATLSALAPRGVSAASCSGMSHKLTLSDGTVSPGSGTAGSTFTFTVVYTDNADCPPNRIEVTIEGMGAYPLSYVGGNLTSGATFRVKVGLPAGRRSYWFEASSGSGAGARTVKLKNVDPAEVVITAPPKPTPPPPAPTPAPTRAPAPTPAPTPAATPVAQHSQQPSPGSTATASPASSARSAAFPRPLRDDDGGPRIGGGGPLADAAQTVSRGDAPLPWLALLVSSITAFVGMILFAILSAKLADPAPGPPLALGTRPRR